MYPILFLIATPFLIALIALINNGKLLALGNIEELTKEKGLEDFFLETVKSQEIL